MNGFNRLATAVAVPFWRVKLFEILFHGSLFRKISHGATCTMVLSRNKEAQDIRDQIIRLANRLTELKTDLDQEDIRPPPRFPRKAHPRPKEVPFQMGDRVQVLARDKYYQRQGTITGRSGGKGLYWGLVLDRRSAEKTSPAIRKQAHNLLLLGDA